MFDIIVATNTNLGIGKNGYIPWDCPADRKLFKKLTDNSILIMGRKTIETLPKLPNRIVFCISRKGILNSDQNDSKIFKSLRSALDFAYQEYPEHKVFVAGGGEIYKEALSLESEIFEIHHSLVEDSSECDTFVHLEIKDKVCISKQEEGFKYLSFHTPNRKEDVYLNLIRDVLINGESRVGRNGEVKSLFGKNISFNLQEGFPLLTTKKMFFRGIFEELIFFIRGQTDSKILEEKGVNIWKGNTDRKFLDSIGYESRSEGIMGPLYGYQWRFFNAKYCEKTGKPLEKGVDQLTNVINLIKTDPTSRRIIMTDFNPSQAEQGVLYPCHSLLIQFYVFGEYLDMFTYNRSQDLFLGTPFNIASSALFLSLIANVTGLKPRNLHMGLGDVHIYSQHYECVQTQLGRTGYNFPTLVIKKKIEDLETVEFSDLILQNYHSYPPIKAEMVA